MNEQTSQPNTWRIIVVVAVILIAGAFVMRVLLNASSDTQMLFLGIGTGLLFAAPFKVLPRMGESVRLATEHETGYREGWEAGRLYGKGEGYCSGLIEGMESVGTEITVAPANTISEALCNARASGRTVKYPVVTR